jgi:hypothetical protein
MKEVIMGLICKIHRLWAVILPTLLLAIAFQYAHQLNLMISLIEDLSFKKTITILLISFLAIWSLLYVSSIFFIRLLKWVWFGTPSTEVEKPNMQNNKLLESHTKNRIEYHDSKEQESLFRLDLQDEPIEPIPEAEGQESELSKKMQ